MCTVLLPPGVNPIAVNKYYIISYHKTVGISFPAVEWEIKYMNTKIFLSLSLSNKILKKKMVRK